MLIRLVLLAFQISNLESDAYRNDAVDSEGVDLEISPSRIVSFITLGRSDLVNARAAVYHQVYENGLVQDRAHAQHLSKTQWREQCAKDDGDIGSVGHRFADSKALIQTQLSCQVKPHPCVDCSRISGSIFLLV